MHKQAIIAADDTSAWGATYETPPARTMLPNLERLINFAREQGMPIVWTQSDHSAPFGGVMLKKFPTIREDKYLWKGQPSFEVYEQMLQPKEEGEYRVVKHRYDAFFETDPPFSATRASKPVHADTAAGSSESRTAAAIVSKQYRRPLASMTAGRFGPGPECCRPLAKAASLVQSGAGTQFLTDR